MPTAPRVRHATGTKIAFKILGTPPNMKSTRSEYQKKINRRLLFEETQRVK